MNEIKNIRSECRVVVYRWAEEVLTRALENNDDLLSQAVPIDVSSRVSDLRYSKSLDNPAGSFNFTLENDRDWKETIKPGQWCLIYLSNEGDLAVPEDVVRPRTSDLREIKPRLRCIGYIERVAAEARTLENGALDVVYQVTGRDFGVIYAETTIWHNFFLSEQNLLKASNTYLDVNKIQTVNQLIEVVHQLLFSPLDLNFKPNQKLAALGIQWLLPKNMILALDLKLKGKSRPTFFGNIEGLLDLQKTSVGRPTESPMTFLEGNVWSTLKTLSIEPLHELFPELNNDGAPRLTFRPIPWKIDGDSFKVVKDTILSLGDLANNSETRVLVKPIDILGFNIGEDNHSRYNHFFTYISTARYSPFSNAGVLLQATSVSGRQFPNMQVSSVKRHGLRPMHVEINALTELNEKSDAKPQERLLVQYNEVEFEYWNNAIFFETGTLNLIGNNNTKIGKVVLFDKTTAYNANKIFYIESYEDQYTKDAKGGDEWVQTLQITRGIHKDVFTKQASAEERVDSFTQIGDYVRTK